MISRSERRSPSISAASSAPVRSSRGLLPALGEHLGEVVEHAAARTSIAAVAAGSRTPSSRCTTVGPGAQLARSAAGTPSISLITSIGSLPAKSRMKSQRSALGEGVEVFDRERTDAWLELRDAPRREAPRDQRAQPIVARRIHREERHRRRRVLVEGVGVERDAVAVREALPVLERRPARRRAATAPRSRSASFRYAGASARSRA